MSENRRWRDDCIASFFFFFFTEGEFTASLSILSSIWVTSFPYSTFGTEERERKMIKKRKGSGWSYKEDPCWSAMPLSILQSVAVDLRISCDSMVYGLCVSFKVVVVGYCLGPTFLYTYFHCEIFDRQNRLQNYWKSNNLLTEANRKLGLTLIKEQVLQSLSSNATVRTSTIIPDYAFHINSCSRARDFMTQECVCNIVRFIATKAKLLVKGTFTIFTELLNRRRKKKRTVQWLNMLIDRDIRGGCFTSLFSLSLTSWPGIRGKKEKKNSISVKHFNIKCLSGLLYIYLPHEKIKKRRERYKGERKRKRRGRSEKEVLNVGTRSQSLSRVSL